MLVRQPRCPNYKLKIEEKRYSCNTRLPVRWLGTKRHERICPLGGWAGRDQASWSLAAATPQGGAAAVICFCNSWRRISAVFPPVPLE